MNAGIHVSDELLSALADGALSDVERAEVASHLEACAACARRARLMAATARAVADLPDEAPRVALDLSFTSAAAAHAAVGEPEPARPEWRRWRPPAWVAPVLAAAAVVIVAASVAPGMLGHAGSSGSTASSAAGLAPLNRAPTLLPPAATPPPGTAAGSGLYDNEAAAPAPGAAGATAQRAALGLPDTQVNAQPATSPTGHAVTVTFTVRAPQALALKSLSLVVRQGTSSMLLGTMSGRTLAAGDTAQLTVTWTAGQLGDGRNPGAYTLEGHVQLADGREYYTAITFRAT